MYKKSNINGIAASALFALAAFAFFAFAYPYHLHFHEQLQLFQFTADYFLDTVRIPGGFADWCSRFLVQFFYYSLAGAAIFALALLALQRACWHAMRFVRGDASESPALHALSFVPFVLGFFFLCDDNANLDGIIAIVVSLYAAMAVGRFSRQADRLVLALVLSGVMWFLFGSMSIVFALTLAISEFVRKDSTTVSRFSFMLIVAMVALLPLVCRPFFPYPLKRLYYGIHYHRYHNAIPLLIWLTALAVVLVQAIAASGLLQKIRKQTPAAVVILFTCLASAAAFLPNFNDQVKETVFKYDFMVRMRQWNKILKVASKNPSNSPIPVECVNLALAKTGHLGSDMFSFFQNGPEGLLPAHVADFMSPVPTGEVYYHLGMVNTALNFFYEAQEGFPDFQKSARLYKSMASCYIINGDYEVARKYLNVLSHTIFYRKWAKQNLKLLDKPELIDNDKEYSWIRSVRITSQDFFFSQEEMDSMLGLLYIENKSNIYASEYMLAYCLLKKDLNRFAEILPIVEKGFDARHYQEAYIFYWALTHDGPQGMPNFITEKTYNRFSAFLNDYQSHKDESYMQQKYGNTYWFYYHYRYR